MVAGKGVGGGKKPGTGREGSERPGPARVGAPQDAGCPRPDGCCSGRGLGAGGTGRREHSAAGPGTRQRDPREPPRCPSPATPDGARYTKGLASRRRWRPRGTAGSAQQGGAVAHPAPQPRPRDRPGPTPLPPPLRGVPLPSLRTPPPRRWRSRPRFCAPIPTPRSLGRFHAAPLLGTGKPAENANPRGAVSGPLSQGPERTAGCE